MSETTREVPIIDSRWSSDAQEDVFDVTNPSTGSVMARVRGSSVSQVDEAIAAAEAGFRSWRDRSPAERGRVLLAAAQLIRANADELAELEAKEVGKPQIQARMGDVEACIALFEFFGAMALDLPSSARESAHLLDVTTLHPYGVIAAIIPFNWPPIHTAGKIAPALAVGNAVVLKPPEQAPLTIMRIIDLIREVLPDDVVHVVPGGPAVGAALASSPAIRKLSFTGAPSTGAKVMQAAGANLTPTLMELGGKNAVVVFDDADLDRAVVAAVDGGFFNQGEACTASSRILLQSDIREPFLQRFAEAVERLKVGDALAPDTHVGPLVSASQRDRVASYIEIGLDEGAEILAQASLPTAPDLQGGYYVAPTVLTGVTRDMRVAREEIFGPVVTILDFEDETEAIEIANDTDFGLVGAVFTRDSERALRVAHQLECGLVFVNNYNRQTQGSPFGGIKKSGFGREHARETLAEFGYTKTVRIPAGRAAVPAWPVATAVVT